MKSNPILEEVWRIKDQLAAEAGYDMDRFVDQLRAWSAAHPPSGPVVRNAEELRQLVAKEERQHQAESKMALKEEAPPESKRRATKGVPPAPDIRLNALRLKVAVKVIDPHK